MTLQAQREWQHEAIACLAREAARSADTHLLRMELPGFRGIDLYLKDEAAHPTGSLKHRLARSLFLYGLCNGWIREGTTIVEASSGSTAISEAYFARLLGLPFIAVVPQGTAPRKLQEIAFQGVVDANKDVIPAVREFCLKAETLSWPLKILRAILDDDGYRDELIEILERFDTEYARNVEPKQQVIVALGDLRGRDRAARRGGRRRDAGAHRQRHGRPRRTPEVIQPDRSPPRCHHHHFAAQARPPPSALKASNPHGSRLRFAKRARSKRASGNTSPL